MDEIKFKIALKVNDLYYFMMHHYYSKPAGIIGLVLSIGSLVLLITRWNVTDATAKMLYFIIALLFTVINPLMLLTKAKAQIQRNKSLGGGLEYILSDEHLSVCLGEERADVGWDQIIRVKDNGRELLVYMTAARAYIWPKAVSYTHLSRQTRKLSVWIMMIWYLVPTERKSMPLLKRLLRPIRRDSLFWLVQSPSKALKKSVTV